MSRHGTLEAKPVGAQAEAPYNASSGPGTIPSNSLSFENIRLALVGELPAGMLVKFGVTVKAVIYRNSRTRNRSGFPTGDVAHFRLTAACPALSRPFSFSV
jgi:hypothetical protein